MASSSLGEGSQALAIIVAREQLGADASEAQVEELARETAGLLEGSPLLERLLRPWRGRRCGLALEPG
jgi:hypothetical protein